MNKIKIIDTTLCKENSAFNFKEKIEIARQLERLNVDTIELPEISDVKADILFGKTVSAFLKNSTLSIAAGSSRESIENASAALTSSDKSRIRIEIPVSPINMEYTFHKKGPKMLEWIREAVSMAKSKCENVEFCALDATRAEEDFLKDAIEVALTSGATMISACDNAAEMLPDRFAEFMSKIVSDSNVPVGIWCSNKNNLATASAVLAVEKGVSFVKGAVGGDAMPLDAFLLMMKNCGENYGIFTDVKHTELMRIVKQIEWISNNAKNDKSVVTVADKSDNVMLDGNDSQEDVNLAVLKLGYDLSEDDKAKVYEEFLRVVSKKNVGLKELEAIIASVALQVPATYQLKSYVVNNGNIISATAQITLEKDGADMQGICIGDGPIDASFLAINQIIGHHYELDDFQIQSVTEGKEAMGSALVKLRAGGKLFSGNGISTDIIGASIRAYLNAVNKIVYEEA